MAKNLGTTDDEGGIPSNYSEGKNASTDSLNRPADLRGATIQDELNYGKGDSKESGVK